MDVKWIKICTDIFDDEKMLLIDGLPEHDGIIVVWFKLLCMAGRQNNGGVFTLNDKIAYTDEMLATIFRRPIATVRLALKTFEQFGMIEIINNTITIPNWEKHQSLDKLEQAKEKNRSRVAAYRERQKALANGNAGCNVTVMPCNETDIDKDKDTDKEKEKEGETASRLSPPDEKPKKGGKASKKAEQPNYEEILSTIDDPELVTAYREFIKMRDFIKKPLTEYALQQTIAKVEKLAPYNPSLQKEILDQSITNNWQGVFALKDDSNDTGRPHRDNSDTDNIFLKVLREEQQQKQGGTVYES